ncbi:MAG: hypothetical protein MI864_10420 [Pseudomonadales bacterium]|nr:hypothetical protein [Pseudomonadales bacterium]
MSKYSSYFHCLPDDLKPQTPIPVGTLEWRDIKEFPDYEISTFGSVRRHKPGLNKKYHLVGNILKPYLVDGIYPEVELSNAEGAQRKKIHILLAETFLETKPIEGYVVRHLDHRPQVPTVWSIGWGTADDNTKDRNYHRLIHSLQDPSEEVINCAALLIDMQINGLSGTEASKKWNVSYSKINKLKNGKRHAMELGVIHEVLSKFKKYSNKSSF